MRALLFVITMMISIPSFADLYSTSGMYDLYDENGKHIGKEYMNNETAALHTAISAVAIIISNKYKYSNDVQESFQKMIDNESQTIELSQCDKACKDKVQAEILKKYSLKYQ